MDMKLVDQNKHLLKMQRTAEGGRVFIYITFDVFYHNL